MGFKFLIDKSLFKIPVDNATFGFIGIEPEGLVPLSYDGWVFNTMTRELVHTKDEKSIPEHQKYKTFYDGDWSTVLFMSDNITNDTDVIFVSIKDIPAEVTRISLHTKKCECKFQHEPETCERLDYQMEDNKKYAISTNITIPHYSNPYYYIFDFIDRHKEYDIKYHQCLNQHLFTSNKEFDEVTNNEFNLLVQFIEIRFRELLKKSDNLAEPIETKIGSIKFIPVNTDLGKVDFMFNENFSRFNGIQCNEWMRTKIGTELDFISYQEGKFIYTDNLYIKGDINLSEVISIVGQLEKPIEYDFIANQGYGSSYANTHNSLISKKGTYMIHLDQLGGDELILPYEKFFERFPNFSFGEYKKLHDSFDFYYTNICNKYEKD